MSKLERIKIVFERIFNKIFRVNNIEKLILGKEKMEETLRDAEEKLFEAQGKNKQKEEEIKQIEENIKKLIEISKDLNKEKVKEAAELYKEEKNKKELLLKSLKINEKIVKQLEDKVKIYREKINDLKRNIEVLEMKQNYTENLKEYKKIAKKLDVGDIKDISKEIDEEFYTSEIEVKNIEETGKNVDDFISENGKNDDYAEFMKLVEGDKKKSEKKKIK